MRALTNRLRSAGTRAVAAGTNAPGRVRIVPLAAIFPPNPEVRGAAEVRGVAPPEIPSPSAFFPGRSGSPLAFPLDVVQLHGDQAEAARVAQTTGVLHFPMEPRLRGGRKRKRSTRKRSTHEPRR